MDIRDNKKIRHTKMKHTALKATASAILSLNVEVVMADPCSTIISDFSTAICTFTAPNSSVTVANTGTVGGVLMTAYNPSVNSFILVESGGTINNSGTSGAGANGIDMQNSSLTNGLANSGIINAIGTGLLIGNGTAIQGGLSNNGTISSSSGNFSGISILSHSAITGDITNQGSITAVGGNALLLSLSEINGDISNSGIIESTSGAGIASGNEGNILGTISNTGTIHGAQGILLRSTSQVSGRISNSGIINGDDTSIYLSSSTLSGGLSNSGTISGGVYGILSTTQVTINGAISNSGTISGGDYGISSTTNSTIAGGISNSGIIQGGTAAINIANASDVGNIDILGKTARIIGAVQASNTDMTITNGAEFTSEGDYAVNNFNINQNAVFNMANNIIASSSVNNSGTLAVADSLRTITGAYTQNTGALFQTNVSSTTNYGQLAVTGVADLSQSGYIYAQIEPNSSLHLGDVLFNVINSGSTLPLPTNGFNVSTNSFIWGFTAALNNAGTGVDLTTAINPEASAVCQGAYCQGAANAIMGQVAAGNSVFGSYSTLSSASALQTAASQATSELTNENVQMIQLITRAVVDIVPMWSSLRGKSAGDAMFYQPGKVWIKPYGASMTQNERNTVNGFNATAYGAVIGKDVELNNDGLFGGAFAAGGDNMHGKSVLSGQSINSNAYQGMLYGAKKLPNQVYFAGQGLVGYENNNTNRSIPLYTSTATGAYHSWFTNIRAETGWSTTAFSPNLVLTPEIDASYVFINQGSYQESGSPMALSIANNNNSSLVLGAYANAAYHLTTLKNQHDDIALTGYAGIAGDVMNSQPQIMSTFVASGTSFSTFGVQFNEVVFRGGAGLSITGPTKPFTIELNYDIQAGNNAYSGIGAATIKYKL